MFWIVFSFSWLSYLGHGPAHLLGDQRWMDCSCNSNIRGKTSAIRHRMDHGYVCQQVDVASVCAIRAQNPAHGRQSHAHLSSYLA